MNEKPDTMNRLEVFKAWEPIPGYDRQTYIDNCRKMITINQEKVEETKRMLEEERNLFRRDDLRRQLRGWEKWVARWTEWLAHAERDKEEREAGNG